MDILGLDKELCERRNRVVARREDVEGVPIRFLAETTGTWFTTDWHIAVADGDMPVHMSDVLAAINTKLPEGAAKLTADDVYVHYLEAANSNFIGDRFMFLGKSTLKNIAADAERGFAFMNSHRTGKLSQPSELPFGKTFAGQYQAGSDENGQPQQRAIVGMYMLRGIKPNGEAGPTTDDLHRMILGGQVADVSVGLQGGNALCDVCGVNLRENDCSHAPGTRKGMTEDDLAKQMKRKVPDGKCSYTLEDARCGEVSAVFDGAVPGAGVKKVMSLRKKGKLNHREWKEARAVFGSLLNGDLSMDQDIFADVADAVEIGVRAALSPVDSLESEPETIQQNALASTVTEPREPAALRDLKGVKPMAETQLPVVELDSAGTEALDFAKLNAEMATLRAERDKLAERTAKLEADARNTRFSAEVEGTVTGGVRWFGDHEAHKNLLNKMASAFGEKSPEVDQYILQNRAYAAQLAESKLLDELGNNFAATDEVPALEQLQIKANEIQLASPKLTKEQAFAQATQANPALYEQYVSETRGRK